MEDASWGASPFGLHGSHSGSPHESAASLSFATASAYASPRPCFFALGGVGSLSIEEEDEVHSALREAERLRLGRGAVRFPDDSMDLDYAAFDAWRLV
eukprot:5491508-Prymnesium_polylepis.1